MDAPLAGLGHWLLFAQMALSYAYCLQEKPSHDHHHRGAQGREVAIAADSQSTFGDTRLISTFSDARYNKIFQLDDSFIGISGSAAHDPVFQSALSKLKTVIFPAVRRCSTLFASCTPS